MRHGIAAGEAGKFCGWPANNGAWSWDGGREILVGYTFGEFMERKGHNMKGGGEDAMGLTSRLARSTDGGLTWTSEDPGNYVGDGQTPVPSPGGIAFQAPGFAMRVVGTGYHGAHDGIGSFFVSDNRGKDWRGPYRFNGLMDDPHLQGKEFTARTAYVVTGPDSCLLFMSSRGSDEAYRDKTFVAETTDGGKTFRFVSWVVPLDDPYRAVMPAVSRLEDGSIVVALRRREYSTDICWVDAYGSSDNGRTWTFLSRVGETGKKNGNPPALVALVDGRLACAYGDRTRAKLYARLSSDGGKTWDEEVVLRDDYQPDAFGDMDFGYPRLAVNHENHIVALYYWATSDRPQQFIAATLWDPEKKNGTDWFAEAKFGLFIHWGLYAVTEGEWRGKQVPYIGEWIMHGEKIPAAEYSKLARRFNPVHFDAREWVRLAEAAGMRYLVFTAKHHEGFAMFHSRADPYNVVDATPFKRDVLAELAEACRGTQVKLCVYYSHCVDWHEPHGGNLPDDNKPNYENDPDYIPRKWGNDWDFPPGTPEGFAEYLERKVKPQLREILTNYGPIGMIWFDTPTKSLSLEQAREIKALVKELQPDCLVSARIGHDLGDFDVLGDNKMPDNVRIRRSEACITLNDTWGYKAHDQNWKSADTVRKMLAEANARNTNVLLNIGPQPDGRFPAPAIAVLEDLAEDRAKEQGPVPLFDPTTVDPVLFEGHEYIWAYHLVHLPTVANAVLMEGEHRGFIDIPVWRSKQVNQPFNARVLENHLPLAFFYTADRPWNPYRGNPALRARLEAVLDFWCGSQNADGLFAEYSPEGWGLPATSFGIKMMGETLRLLDESKRAGGPTIDPALHRRTIAAARRSIEALLTDPDLLAHAKRYSNQYTGFWGGALAFLSAHPDDSLRSRLTERVREVMPGLSSPAGYHYENHGCDWGYTLGTHSNNVRHVWNYAQGTELGDLIVAMERPWVEWLAYNAVREPDGSYFTLNRAIETRLTAGGFVTWAFPLAGQIPLARAFAQTGDEHRAQLQAERQQLLESWPDVGPLTGYAPHAFADQLDRHPWHPTASERAAAVAGLPYLARDRFAHQRVDDRPVSLSLDLTKYDRFADQRADDRHPMSSTFVRRPSYYATFNAGAMVAAIQRHGLGLVWSPAMGSVLQAQSRDAAPWGTAPAGGALYEASAFQPAMHVGGRPVAIEPGARDLPGGDTGDVVFTYPLAKYGQKTLTFASGHIAVQVVHPGVFTEHLPLLMCPEDDLVIETDSVRLQRGDQMLVIALTPGVASVMEPTEVRHGPFQVVRLKLTASESLEYRLSFRALTD